MPAPARRAPIGFTALNMKEEDSDMYAITGASQPRPPVIEAYGGFRYPTTISERPLLAQSSPTAHV
jgi:hypothetical protein